MMIRTTWAHTLFAAAIPGLIAIFSAPAYAKFAELATADAPPEQRAFLEELDKLTWVEGPTTVQLAGNASVTIPEGYLFLDQKNTTKYLELNENLSSGNEVLIVPEDLSWSAYLEYLSEGYVKDDEQIDADALLKQLKEDTEAANAERSKRGWGALHVVGWAVAPNYNRETKRLEWATTLRSDTVQSANFFTKILGRRGHTSVQLVSRPEDLAGAETSLNDALRAFQYKPGDKYAEFKPGDKVAEYGLAALIVGGAAAIATKKGFWAVLAGFFAAAWKFVAALVLGALAWLKSLFKKKE